MKNKMSFLYKAELSALIFTVIFSLAIIAYAGYVWMRLRIRLNRETKFRWVIMFLAVIVRIALDIDSYFR